MTKFNNKPNERVELEDGREIFLSRSCAVMSVIIALHGNTKYVLMNKRGPAAPDFVGHWNCPCGYLDWDETSGEAALREIYEETGFDLKAYAADHPEDFISYDFDQPWWVNSDPISSNRQNVTMRHGAVFRCEQLPVLTDAHNEVNGETDGIAWVPLSNITMNSSMGFAFGHDEIISEYIL